MEREARIILKILWKMFSGRSENVSYRYIEKRKHKYVGIQNKYKYKEKNMSNTCKYIGKGVRNISKYVRKGVRNTKVRMNTLKKKKCIMNAF